MVIQRAEDADWPGLVSPAVVEARAKIGSKAGYFTWAEVAEALKPAWIAPAPMIGLDGSKRFSIPSLELQAVFDGRKSGQTGPGCGGSGMNMPSRSGLWGVSPHELIGWQIAHDWKRHHRVRTFASRWRAGIVSHAAASRQTISLA